MSATGDAELADRPSLGELLALLHRADAPFDRIAATYRIWRHEQRSAAARQAHVEEEKRRAPRSPALGTQMAPIG